jgi:hypothetical protein
VSNATTPAGSGRHEILFFVVSLYLIGTFLWRVLVEAHEYAMRTEQMLTIGLDLLMVIGLFGIRAHGPKPLFWIAMVAGVGLLLIRFTSDAAWWTGHLMYSLPPR